MVHLLKIFFCEAIGQEEKKKENIMKEQEINERMAQITDNNNKE